MFTKIALLGVSFATGQFAKNKQPRIDTDADENDMNSYHPAERRQQQQQQLETEVVSGPHPAMAAFRDEELEFERTWRKFMKAIRNERLQKQQHKKFQLRGDDKNATNKQTQCCAEDGTDDANKQAGKCHECGDEEDAENDTNSELKCPEPPAGKSPTHMCNKCAHKSGTGIGAADKKNCGCLCCKDGCPDEDNKDDSSCFSGETTILTQSGNVVLMKDLKIGDVVRTANSYEKVIDFLHDLSGEDVQSAKARGLRAKVYKISHQHGMLNGITGDHLVFLADGNSVQVKDLDVGMQLVLADGVASRVVAIDITTTKTLRAPLLSSGTIVVDNLVTSNYALSSHWLGHFATIPARLASGGFVSDKKEGLRQLVVVSS